MSQYDLEIIAIASQIDSIEHHGVKGMKWGVRKFSNRFSERRKNRNKLKKASSKWNTKNANRHLMTDKDLRNATNRLRMENDFAEQVQRANRINKKPSVKSAAMKAAKFVVPTVAGVALKTVATDFMKNKPKDYAPLTKQIVNVMKK